MMQKNNKSGQFAPILFSPRDTKLA